MYDMDWQDKVKLGVAVILLGFLGMGLFTLAQTAYYDHQNLKAVIELINKNIQAEKNQQK